MTLLYAAVLLHLMLEVRESFCFTLTSLACQTNGRALFAKKNKLMEGLRSKTKFIFNPKKKQVQSKRGQETKLNFFRAKKLIYS